MFTHHQYSYLKHSSCITETQTNAQVYLIETYGTRNYTQFDYSDPNQHIYFLFGRETTGLPQAFAQARAEQCLRIPQSEHIRSLNLSNAAAIVLYEALRQQSFPSLT
ncbi:tRNA (cytidine(34)-2'-O)-methyltransferase [Snodgrassella alvi]|uniref:tRNA (cytidine(34)-2'-O)-methyltransferase n=1 Tax=Snodgrassella alvi TaxID=1196083 RepID=UPI000C1EA62A|nr:TrmH family RNA methyltransferase [Snodgrassella alvi]WLT02792.1 TrmH family RNA methyltransferase [Snodgrassella alvi]WLT04864.1 TrmH family RNA methyltransferase [Snodgrassella alvi]